MKTDKKRTKIVAWIGKTYNAGDIESVNDLWDICFDQLTSGEKGNGTWKKVTIEIKE